MFDGEAASLNAILSSRTIKAPKPIKVISVLIQIVHTLYLTRCNIRMLIKVFKCLKFIFSIFKANVLILRINSFRGFFFFFLSMS